MCKKIYIFFKWILFSYIKIVNNYISKRNKNHAKKLYIILFVIIFIINIKNNIINSKF